MIVRPKEFTGVLKNPWMGWGLWAGPIYFTGAPRTLEENTTGFGDDAPLFQWVLLDWMWADLEPQEGQFDWAPLDTIIQYWAQRGKQINLRIWVTDDPGWDGAPGAAWACPKWVYDAGLRWRDYQGEGGAAKREPDYADPSFQTVFMPRLKNLLQAVANRYDHPGHPFNFFGCMGYGQWGEWHTLWSNYPWPSKKVKHDVLAGIVNLYADTFQNIDLAISYCLDTFNIGETAAPFLKDYMSFLERQGRDSLDDFLYRQALDVAMQRGFLLGRHGFIDGLWHNDRLIMQNEWKRTALYAEANWCYTDIKDQGTHGTLDENIDIMLEWHSTYGHFYTDAASYRRTMRDDPQSYARGLKPGGLGYRFVLKEASWPDQAHPGHLLLFQQSWQNQNVARLHKRHLLTLYLSGAEGNDVFSEPDRAFNSTSWISGEDYAFTSIYHLPKDLPAGAYDLSIAMTDLDGTPRIALGIEGGDDRLRYKLGKIEVV
jgi:hypothetical protein